MQGGSIYLRKDGRYEGRIYKTEKAEGKRTYVSFYGHSAEEVKVKIESAYNTVVSEKNNDIILSVKQIAYEWLSVISTRIKESTGANYIMKAKKHLLPYFGDMQCSAILSKDIYRFIDQKAKEGLSYRYISDILILLKSIFKYAHREYNVKNVIDGIIMPKKNKTEVQLLNDHEQANLKDYIKKNDNKTSLGISIALYTGMRIGEICALMWKDIDFDNRIISVNKTMQRIQNFSGDKKTKLVVTEPKSESSKREIPIPDCLIDILVRNKGDENGFVLSDSNKLVEPRTLQYRFANVLKRIKASSVHFHSLRHLFATKCIALGFDVKTLSEILGHSSIELTLNKYVHSSMDRKKRCMEMVTW